MAHLIQYEGSGSWVQTPQGRVWCSAKHVGAKVIDLKPMCFAALLPGYLVGEMWIGVSLTIAVELVPPPCRTATVALYLFVVDNAGNVGPLAYGALARRAAARAREPQRDAMLLLVPGCYALAGLLFALAGPLVRRDLLRLAAAAKRAQRAAAADGARAEPGESHDELITALIDGGAADSDESRARAAGALTRSDLSRLIDMERRHTWTATEGRVPVAPGANMYAAAIVVRTAVRRSSDEPHEPT